MTEEEKKRKAREPMPIAGIMEIDPYIGGKGEAPTGVAPIKLSANETPLGASAAAKAAFMREAENLHIYPAGDCAPLRAAIAKAYGLEPERLVCGSGSDELLSLLAHAYLGPDDEAIYSEHGFLMYRISVLATGAKPVIAPEKDLTAQPDAIIERVSAKTKAVFLANPNNPTGTYLAADKVRELRARLPENVLLILDGAYAEYARRDDYDCGIELVRENRNTIMLRTFSKIHGLAALRIGWLYGPEAIVDVINRIRGPFNVNGAALAAAIAAIEDRDHIERAAAHNDKWLAWTRARLEEIGLRVTPSAGNFLLIHFSERDDSKSAAKADDYLIRKGYILRRMESYGFPNALRMSIGSEQANEGVIATLKEFFDG